MLRRTAESNCLLLIPAYNEERVVGILVQSAVSLGYTEIIVVDDGSIDNTALVAERSGATVLRHSVNCGKGAALRTGFRAVQLKTSNAVVVTLDADGQHDPREIIKLVSAVEEGFDVSFGVRTYGYDRMPLMNRVANFMADILTFTLSGIHVSDSQCGFRAYSPQAISEIKINSDGYACESEIIEAVSRAHLSFVQVPVTTIYSGYSVSKNCRQNLNNGFRTLYDLFFS